MVTFFFNYADCPRMLANYLRWRKQWQGFELPVYTVEVLLRGQLPSLEGDRVHHVTVQEPLFHKEAAVNYMLHRLPADTELVLWIDSDLMFSGLAGLRKIPGMLQRHAVVQLMRSIQYLGPGGEHLDRLKKSFFHDQRNGYHGGAFAARADTLKACGGLPVCSPTGGGDSVFLMGCMGPELVKRWEWYVKKFQPSVQQNMREYAAKAFSVVKGRAGVLDQCTGRHLWHGDTETREYQTRHSIIERLDYAQTKLDGNGFLEFTTPQPEIRQGMLDYWHRRRCKN